MLGPRPPGADRRIANPPQVNNLPHKRGSHCLSPNSVTHPSQPLLFRIPYAIRMQAVLREEALPAKLTLNPELRMNDDEYYAFCMVNADWRFEQTEQGEIIIVPPAGAESESVAVQRASMAVSVISCASRRQ